MGKIFLYYGTGAGKTTNALGLALRCAGHRLRAVIIQFMKGRKDIGEYLVKEMLFPYYEIYQFGRTGWVNLRNPSNEDKALAKKALKKAEEILETKPHLLVLDEVCLATYIGLVDVKEILKVLRKVPEETDVVLTGRYCPPELIDQADFVNLIAEVKAPRKIYTRIGITH
ncbi:TPA: cob(I)yrinic acid a,c-diamide adenosyltransferase [Candidatus Bathyarchaeota archaeon]|nr:cob(I)yrinic acid a,c-diamide adenosyltransferase [Candidatus Bathyarchaeota archaeon]